MCVCVCVCVCVYVCFVCVCMCVYTCRNVFVQHLCACMLLLFLVCVHIVQCVCGHNAHTMRRVSTDKTNFYRRQCTTFLVPSLLPCYVPTFVVFTFIFLIISLLLGHTSSSCVCCRLDLTEWLTVLSDLIQVDFKMERVCRFILPSFLFLSSCSFCFFLSFMSYFLSFLFFLGCSHKEYPVHILTERSYSVWVISLSKISDFCAAWIFNIC